MNECVTCDGCLPRLCVTKDEGGRVTALSYWDDDEELVEVPDCDGVATDCCEGLLPEVLYLNFPDGLDGCPCNPPTSVALVYSGDPANGWTDTLEVESPCTNGLAQVRCVSGPQWQVYFGAPGGCIASALVALGPCADEPVLAGTIDFTSTGGGEVPFTVTRTPP